MKTPLHGKHRANSCLSIYKSLLLPAFFCIMTLSVGAQDFTGIGKRKPFSLTGTAGAQFDSRLNSSGAADPFSYLISAQLNPVIYGFALPISFCYSDSRFSYAQPFSRISFNPSYKWLKAHIGRTSMEMHPYGLSGIQFDGVGISLESVSFPVHFSAMYGRLAKARKADSIRLGNENSYPGYLPASYRRSGWAFKIGFTHKKQQLDLHFFSAQDHIKSLSESWRASLAPQENMVLAMDFSFNLYKGFTLSGQAGVSAWTQDSRSPGKKRRGVLGIMTRPFIKQHSSTALGTAGKIRLGYKGISVAYERISPEYQSLGTAYFNRDFENVVAAFTHAFKKIDVNAELGWQRDDLRSSKASRMNRFVGSAFINYRIDERFALTASYSNFTMYTQMKPVDLSRPDEPMVQDPDTISYRQISQQATFGFDFHTAPYARYRQNGGFEFSYQSSRERNQRMFSDYFYAALRHGIELSSGYTLNSALNFTTRLDRSGERRRSINYHIGPSFTCLKSWFDKTLACSAGLSYYLEMNGTSTSGGIADLRLRGTYTLKKSHEFELQLSGRLRSAFSSSFTPGQEFFVQVGYRYRFSVNPFRKPRYDKEQTANHSSLSESGRVKG